MRRRLSLGFLSVLPALALADPVGACRDAHAGDPDAHIACLEEALRRAAAMPDSIGAEQLESRARLRDPLKLKQLQKGLAQLSEEGATQFFKPLMSTDLILGAVGVLQFDVAAYRLKDEYGVEAIFEPAQVATARWIRCPDEKTLDAFRDKNALHLAIDAAGELVYLAPTRVNLQLAQERAPNVTFLATREITAA